MLDEEALSKLIKAGKIAKKTLEYASNVIKPGARLIDVVNRIENFIRENSGDPAFPVNIGIDNIAAHYTPIHGDQGVIGENSVVKVDIGVHVDGYIADTATTISFNPVYEGLVESCRRALEKAIEILKPGIRALEIGRVIEEVIKSHGYKPIRNLSGHGIERYTIHSGVIIPNYNDIFNRQRLGKGIYAIEPFATNGVGLVRESDIVTIYALKPGIRNIPPRVKEFYDYVYRTRRNLPFAARWYIERYGDLGGLMEIINTLRGSRGLVEYPVLVEREGGIVVQFEHTIIVVNNEIIVSTL